MVVIVSDVEAALFAGPGEQTFGVVLEVLVPGVLHHQAAAVVAVVALAELDDAVERVVLHGDDVAPVGQRQQVAVVIIAEVPRLVWFHASQLAVWVVSVVLDVGVRVDAHALTRVGTSLSDLAALGVAKLHAEHLHALNVQLNLGGNFYVKHIADLILKKI